jgi:hypothetical protein
MAVADAAQDDSIKPPPEVIMASRINKWGDPWGGGWMDWPAGLVNRLTVAENITNAMRSAGRAKPGKFGEWEKSNPHEAKIYHEMIGLRIKMAKAEDD